jgi:hypothetical protein
MSSNFYSPSGNQKEQQETMRRWENRFWLFQEQGEDTGEQKV